MLKSILAIILAAATAALAADSFLSDFTSAKDAGNLKDWQLTGGQFRIQDGWLLVTSDRANPQGIWRQVRLDGDGTFRGIVRNAHHCHRTVLLAGAYRLEINNEFGELKLHRQVGKDWKQVAKVKDYERDAVSEYEFEVRLTISGKQITAYVDRRELILYEDPYDAPVGGPFGFAGGWGTDVAWRDFQFTRKPDTSCSSLIARPIPADKDLVQVTWVRGLSPDSVSFDGETNGLTCQFTTGRPAATRVFLSFELVDVFGRLTTLPVEQVTLQPGAQVERRLAFRPDRRGCFKVVLRAGTEEGSLRWVEDLGSFTILPKVVYSRPRSPDSVFGGHMDGINLDWHLTAGRKLGIQWARCHDMLQYTWWDRVQPDGPTQWKWFDKPQKQVDDLGFETLGEFLRTPKWAGKKVQLPPDDYAAFGSYVAQTVGHYHNSIHCWEVWNEPHYGGFWQGSPQEYARLLGVAYREAKKADPGCFIVGGGGVDAGNARWLESMIGAIDGRPMDAFSIHYISPDAAAPQLARLRGLLKARGIDVPVWNTEASVLSTSFLDQVRPEKVPDDARYTCRNACAELVRMYMGNIGNGVQRIFYYSQADPWRVGQFPKPRTSKQGLLNADMWDEGRMLKPIAAAHAALAWAIEGKRFVEEVKAGDVRAFIFADKSVAVAVQYAIFRSFNERRSVGLSLPAGRMAADFTMADMMANEQPVPVSNNLMVLPLSREPVYLMVAGATGAETLAAMYRAAKPNEGPIPGE